MGSRCADSKKSAQFTGVALEFLVAHANRLEHRCDGSAGIGLQFSVLRIVLDQGCNGGVGCHREDVEQVAHSGLSLAVVGHRVIAVGDCALELLFNVRWTVREIDDACFGVGALRHLVRGALEVHDPCTSRGSHRLGDDEGVAEAMVEPECDVASDFDVLSLVVTDGNFLGVVEQDVGGLEGGVGEEACRHEVRLLSGTFVLELRHAAQFAETDRAFHDPAELCVLRDV